MELLYTVCLYSVPWFFRIDISLFCYILRVSFHHCHGYFSLTAWTLFIIQEQISGKARSGRHEQQSCLGCYGHHNTCKKDSLHPYTTHTCVPYSTQPSSVIRASFHTCMGQNDRYSLLMYYFLNCCFQLFFLFFSWTDSSTVEPLNMTDLLKQAICIQKTCIENFLT